MSARRGSAGFSMIEVLVAMGITGVIVAGIASLFFRAAEQAANARDDTRMTLMASTRIEELRRQYWTNSASPPGDWTTGSHPLTGAYYSSMGSGSPNYFYRWTVEQPASLLPFGRVLTVEVWRHPQRKLRLTQIHGCANCT